MFVIVSANHNSFTSFGSNGIIGNPQAPNITALWNKYNVATNYNGVWHPSLPNYLAMITGNFIGTDVIGTGHAYPAGSTVGISMTIQRPFPPITRRPRTPRFIAGWRIGPRLYAGQGRKGLARVPSEHS